MPDNDRSEKLRDGNSSDLDNSDNIGAEASSNFDNSINYEEVLDEDAREPKLSETELSEKNFNDLMKKFRSQSAGIISEFRRKSAYIPESVRRAEKQAKARSRNKKKLRWIYPEGVLWRIRVIF